MSTAKSNRFPTLETFLNICRSALKSKHVRYGIPFLVFVIGGSFGLREWTSIRYEFSNKKAVSDKEAEKMGLKKTKKVTVEDVYEEIQKLDIDNWENKRGPRPWEETPQK